MIANAAAAKRHFVKFNEKFLIKSNYNVRIPSGLHQEERHWKPLSWTPFKGSTIVEIEKQYTLFFPKIPPFFPVA